MVLATGYRRWERHPLIEELAPYLISNGDRGYEVDRHYRIQASAEFRPRLFLQGFCEDTHGLSDTLLSTLPMRSIQILQSLLTEEEVAEHGAELAVGAGGIGV